MTSVVEAIRPIFTPYVRHAETGEPFPFTGVGAEVLLDTIAATTDRFYAVTRLGTEYYGQAGYCPCKDGHDDMPNSWIEYTEPGKLIPKTIQVHYCNAVPLAVSS